MEALIVALVTAVLSGAAGTTAEASIALYAPQATIVWIDGKPVEIGAGETHVESVQVPITAGRATVPIQVVSAGVTHELTVTTIGKRRVEPKLWLLLVPAITLLLSVRFQKRADSS